MADLRPHRPHRFCFRFTDNTFDQLQRLSEVLNIPKNAVVAQAIGRLARAEPLMRTPRAAPHDVRAPAGKFLKAKTAGASDRA